MNLIEELRRRHVFRTAGIYIVAAWALIEGVDLVGDIFEIGDTVPRLLVFAAILAFVPVLLFSWFYEITPEGVVRHSDLDSIHPHDPVTRSKVDFLIWAGLAVAISYIGFDIFTAAPPRYELSLPEPLVSDKASEYFPSISSDGNFVAFALVVAHNPPNIFVRAIDNNDAEAFTDGDAPEWMPTWSPNGTSIAFWRRSSDDRWEIVVKPFPGGSENIAYRTSTSGVREGLDWSPDGRFLLFSEQDANGPPGSKAVFKFELSTGALTQLTFPAANVKAINANDDIDDARPKISPDGETVAFRRNVGFLESICVVPFNGGTVSCLTGDELILYWDHEWLADSKTIAVVPGGPIGGGRKILAYTVEGGPPYDLLAIPDVSSVSVAHDAGRVIIATQKFDRDLMRIRGPAADSAGAPVNIAASTQDEVWPSISPDGTELVFFSRRNGRFSLWRARTDDQGNPREFVPNVLGNYPRWTPNGKSIAYTASPYLNQSRAGWTIPINIVDAAGSYARQLIEEGWGPTFSADGQWVYYHSIEGLRDDPCVPSAYRIFRGPVGGGESELLIKCGFRPIEGQDGRLYFLDRNDGDKIVSVSIGGNDFRTEVESVNFVFWDLSREHLVFVDGDDDLLKVRNLITGVTRTWAEPFADGSIPRDFALRSLSVSLDDEWIVYTRADQGEVDLFISELSLAE